MSSHGTAELSQSQCFRVIDEIAEINPHILLILTGGEPLLRPDILEISKYASDTGFLVVMGTNGVLLNDAVSLRRCNSMVLPVQV